MTIKIQRELKSSNFSSERFPLIQSRCDFPWIKCEIKDEVTFAADTTKLWSFQVILNYPIWSFIINFVSGSADSQKKKVSFLFILLLNIQIFKDHRNCEESALLKVTRTNIQSPELLLINFLIGWWITQAVINLIFILIDPRSLIWSYCLFVGLYIFFAE